MRTGGRLTWRSAPTDTGEAIDELFLHNIRVCRRENKDALAVVRDAAATRANSHLAAHSQNRT